MALDFNPKQLTKDSRQPFINNGSTVYSPIFRGPNQKVYYPYSNDNMGLYCYNQHNNNDILWYFENDKYEYMRSLKDTYTISSTFTPNAISWTTQTKFDEKSITVGLKLDSKYWAQDYYLGYSRDRTQDNLRFCGVFYDINTYFKGTSQDSAFIKYNTVVSIGKAAYGPSDVIIKLEEELPTSAVSAYSKLSGNPVTKLSFTGKVVNTPNFGIGIGLKGGNTGSADSSSTHYKLIVGAPTNSSNGCFYFDRYYSNLYNLEHNVKYSSATTHDIKYIGDDPFDKNRSLFSLRGVFPLSALSRSAYWADKTSHRLIAISPGLIGTWYANGNCTYSGTALFNCDGESATIQVSNMSIPAWPYRYYNGESHMDEYPKRLKVYDTFMSLHGTNLV